MRTFSTGDVARICGLKSARTVAKMIDKDEMPGDLVDSVYRRKRTRRVTLRALIEYMQEQKIPLNGLADDIDAQKLLLHQQTAELKKTIESERRRSGVLSGFKGLADAILEVIKNMDPLDNLSGASEDRQRMAIFREVADVMRRHINLRAAIAVSRRK